MQATRGTPLTDGPAAAPALSPRQRRACLALFGGLAALVLGLDQLSKVLVVAHLEGSPPLVVVPGVLDLTVTRNSGAAFSVGTGATWFFTAVAVAVVVALLRAAPRLTRRSWAVVFGLALGGALGNLTDRLVRAPGFPRGHVVDWIHLHHWPVFNVADSALTIGIVLALWLTVSGRGLGE